MRVISERFPDEFYLNDDVVGVSRALLGCHLFTHLDGKLTGGIIVETEGYKGPDDRGSHAYNNRLTERTEVMYHRGGVAYVYLCYGIHFLFNVVTGREGLPHAVLIRAIEPTHGQEAMRVRRNLLASSARMTAGPGALAQALGINKSLNGALLSGDQVWIEQSNPLADAEIIASARVGMNFTGAYKEIPWRFRIQGNAFTSRAK